MTVIDVHTHMLDRGWLRLLKEKGAPRYDVAPITADLDGIYHDGALFMTPMPGHFDYDLRVADMAAAGVDLAIVSLTCPNVYWGDAEVSLAPSHGQSVIEFAPRARGSRAYVELCMEVLDRE